jgi:N-acetylneuraminic acid mutarotase
MQRKICTYQTELTFNNKTVYINKHILDYAINDAILIYKSCTTNMKNGNIKSFRLSSAY